MSSGMQVTTDQHIRLFKSILSKIEVRQRFLIAVDARPGAGKSTLSRWLAWQLGWSIVETDLYLDRKAENQPSYILNELRRVITHRLDRNLPVLVEGIMLLQLLEAIELPHDYLVYVEYVDESPERLTENSVLPYEKVYRPRQEADFVFIRNEDFYMSLRD